MDAQRLDQCKYCGRPIGVLTDRPDAPVWVLAGKFPIDREWCLGHQAGGHRPRGWWEARRFGDGPWQMSRTIAQPGKPPWDEPPIEDHPDLGQLAAQLDQVIRLHGSGRRDTDPALSDQNEKIVRSMSVPPFSWDSPDISAADFEPGGTPCDGCGRDDLPVRGSETQKLCRYCDELRIMKPAGTVEHTQAAPPVPEEARSKPEPGQAGKWTGPPRPSFPAGIFIMLAGIAGMLVTSADNNFFFAVFVLGMVNFVFSSFGRR